MKKNKLLLLFVATAGLMSCENTDDGRYAEYQVAKPIKVNKVEFLANTVAVTEPVPVESAGKIYAYKDYIFVNELNKGVHVVDNSDPNTPKIKLFIKIDGNVDISIKEDRLYADSYSDLVVFDISDINSIKLVNRLPNVIGGGWWGGGIWLEDVEWPQADFYDYDGIDYDEDVVVGWEVVTERRLISEYENRFGNFAEGDVAFNTNAAGPTAPTTGQGGSLARFKIVDDYLYAVDSHNINIFDITDLEKPEKKDAVYAGFDIETIFNQGQYLFLGSMRGMYIYDITAPAAPSLVSEFEHGTACDPVVVDGDYAYVTLRGGNMCGATESGLFIVDISEITKPVLTKQYPMDEPYGLGIKDEKLFVCDGSSGLKVYDKTDVLDLKQLNHFEDINTFDVIPLQNSLLMVGNKVLNQYEYLNDDIRLLSTLELN